jgi:peptide-methionine (S)-S-oxide reductase
MKIKAIYLFATILLFFSTSCTNAQSSKKEKQTKKELSTLSKAYFASGCFWCVEAIYESVEGVEEAVSGYAGGTAADATYSLVSSGRTNHAEAIEVFYDKSVVPYETLVKVFYGSHDPTTLNRQGPDAGPQYRSAIFFQNEEEKEIAIRLTEELNNSEFKGGITTQIVPLEKFYDAEVYHQDYEVNNPNNPYIRSVSIPRLKAFQKKFPKLLKDSAH